MTSRFYSFVDRRLERQSAQELCESGGGRPWLPVPNSPYGLYGRKATLNLKAWSAACQRQHFSNWWYLHAQSCVWCLAYFYLSDPSSKLGSTNRFRHRFSNSELNTWSTVKISHSQATQDRSDSLLKTQATLYAKRFVK